MDEEIDADPAGARIRRGTVDEPLPAVPVRAERADLSARQPLPGRQVTIAPIAAEARRERWHPGLPESLDAVDTADRQLPQLLGRGDGHRLELLGRVRGPHRPPASRCWPTTRTWARRCPASGTQVGLHCRQRQRRVPVRRHRVQFSGVPGCGDRAQQRDLVGLHQPRSGRHRPLPGEASRQQRRSTATSRRAAEDPRPRRSRSPARTNRRRSPSARPGTGRSSPTSSEDQRASAGSPPSPARRPGQVPGTRRTASRCSWTALIPGRTADALFAIEPGAELGGVPRRGQAVPGRRRRTSCTPTPTATSATRRPA